MWEMGLIRAPWNLCGLIVCSRGADPSSRWVGAGWYRFRASGLQRVEQRRWSGFLIAESTAELRELWSMKGTWGKYSKEALYHEETTNWSWILSSWLLNSRCNGCFNRFLFCREDWDPRIWIPVTGREQPNIFLLGEEVKEQVYAGRGLSGIRMTLDQQKPPPLLQHLATQAPWTLVSYFVQGLFFRYSLHICESMHLFLMISEPGLMWEAALPKVRKAERKTRALWQEGNSERNIRDQWRTRDEYPTAVSFPLQG